MFGFMLFFILLFSGFCTFILALGISDAFLKKRGDEAISPAVEEQLE
jgi:hypothetical protein